MYLSKKMLKLKLYIWITDKKIEKLFEDKNIFFILSIGRSGTKFLANLLDKAKNTYIVHEPVRSDHRAYQEAFHSEKKALSYIENFRRKEIYLRAKKREFFTYGEVNSILRRHYTALNQVFPKATFIHLIRDGRDSVRSMMSRKTMTPLDLNTKKIFPLDGDPWKLKWSKMSRFERICWYWQNENKYLNKYFEKPIKFEEIISNYHYFNKNILEPLNIEISEDTWLKEVNEPKNVTINYKIPHWKEWNNEMINSFNKICGSIMTKNDYNLIEK